MVLGLQPAQVRLRHVGHIRDRQLLGFAGRPGRSRWVREVRAESVRGEGGYGVRETDLCQPVTAWLRERGYDVRYEVNVMGGCVIDIVGMNSAGELVAVELKLSCTQKVFQQAMLAQRGTHYAYTATPTLPRDLTWHRKHGVGALRVIGQSVEVLVAAQQNKEGWPLERYMQAARRRFAFDNPSYLTGGMRPPKGHGPAMECARRVVEYLRAKPGATWAEIYANVPNHYAHARSMQGAISCRLEAAGAEAVTA